MVSARTGGLAVALGIGYAVAAGAGVAAAEPTDGASGADSAKSASSSPSATDTKPADTKPADTKPASPSTSTTTPGTSTSSSQSSSSSDASATDTSAGKKPAKTSRGRGSSHTDGDTDRKRPESTAPSKVSTSGDATDATKTGADTDTDSKQPAAHTATTQSVDPDTSTPSAETTPAVTVAAVSQPVDPPQEPKPVEAHTAAAVASVEPLATATEDPAHSQGGAPTAPTDSPLTWTVAAAARRELAVPAVDVDQKATPKVAAAVTTPVIATEQIPPLAFLQQIPIFGPAFVTPVVALISQVPVVSDVLHPFIGYPVQWGLPAGAPTARDVKLTSTDGTQIYVHFMPATGLAAGAKAPTVLEGPGLGLPGATNINGTFLDPVLADTVGMIGVGVLRQSGYNVVTWDPRGEWNSGGTLEMNSPDFEGQDMSTIISWIATQPDALLDSPGDPRIGMVGVSYGGGIQLVTASIDKRVDAIVPTITYNALTTSLDKADAFKTSWATPLTAVLELLGGRINPRILPATIYGDLTGQLSPDDLALFTARNPNIGAITAPTLLIQGTADTLFSLAESDATAKTLLANGVDTKVIWFCGGHGVCLNNLFDLSDGALIQNETLDWLAKYVKKDPDVDTGPQFQWVDQRGQWYSAAKYPVEPGTPITAAISGPTNLPVIPYLGGSGLPFIPIATPALNAVNLKLPAATTTTYLVGAPKLTLTYSGTGTVNHVYAQLVDESTGFVLGYLATPIPVQLDGQTHDLTVDLEPVSYTLAPGQSVTLQLVSSAGQYQTIVPSFGTFTVEGMQVSVPTADPAAVTTTSSV